MKNALTIAGSDPSGGAGIQADLRVFRELGVHGLSVIAALTAQNSRGVGSVQPVGGRFVGRQLEVLLEDMRPDALKTGMLYSAENIRAVARIVKRHDLGNLVIDPVFRSSSGRRLAEDEAVAAMKKYLLPLCTVITPNMHEAALLSGIEVNSIGDMEKAAVILNGMGAASVVVTGGHLDRWAVDVVYNGDFQRLKSRKKKGEYHGTGCAFSAALTSLLARGFDLNSAASEAKGFMNRLLVRSFSAGSGMRLLGI